MTLSLSIDSILVCTNALGMSTVIIFRPPWAYSVTVKSILFFHTVGLGASPLLTYVRCVLLLAQVLALMRHATITLFYQKDRTF
jgi:hypothetical protein